MEAVELGLREALFKDACGLLQQLYSQPGLEIPGDTSRQGEKCHAQRSINVKTLFGPAPLARNYYYDWERGTGRTPLDEALGLTESFSPGLVRLSSRVAAREGYEGASQDMLALAGVAIEGRQIHRLVNRVAPQVAIELKERPAGGVEPIPVMYIEADGTGVPMVAEALAGRKGKQPDGTAKTREVKLGCVFTQTKRDEQGEPLRDHQSTTYVGSFETAQDFGLRIRAEALRRGIARARKVVFIGDGAAWIWEIAADCFGDALQILDLYHALEHLGELCEGLYGTRGLAQRTLENWGEMFKNDQVQEVIALAHRRLKKLGPLKNDSLEKQIAYFEHHQHRMLYKTYRDQGLFYGSGVAEAGCRAVIGQRLKESGMFWTETGGTSVLTLRCALKSNRWDECWDGLNNSRYLKIRAAA